MSPEYPNLYQYKDLVSSRDNGAMLIILLAIIVVAGLYNLRDVVPSWMPKIRDGLIILFYCTLIIMVVESLLGLEKRL